MPTPDASVKAAFRGRVLGPATLGMVVACVAVVLGIHRESPFTLVSAHGLLHSAIVERFLIAPWVFPPENPFFAGEPLAYYWIFHAMTAGLASGLGIDPLRAIEFAVVLAMVGLVVLAAGLGRSTYGRVGFGLVIAFLVLAGAHAQAPLVLAWKVLRIGGLPLDDGTYLWGLVHPASEWMRLGDPYGKLGPLVNFYLNTTSRPLALTTLVGVMWALGATLRGKSKAWIALLLGTVLLSCWSPIIAIAAGASLAGAVIVVAAGQRFGVARISSDSSIAALPACLALFGGLALAFPTYAHLLSGGAGEGNGLFGGGLQAVLEQGWGALASGWALAGLAVLGWWRAPEPRRAELAVFLVAAAPLLLATAVFVLPAGNFDNFHHAALVLLALPAAGAIRASDGSVSRPLLCGVLLLFLPTLLLVLWTYTGRPSTEVGSRAGHLVQIGGSRAVLYDWLRENSPADAVVVIDPGPPTRASQGNTAELPALTGRTLWTERAHHYIVSPYPEATARVEIAKQLSAGRSLSASQQARVVALGRPVFVIVEGAAREAAEARWGAPTVSSRELALFRWKANGSPERF
ncbi:MAG: hypothetical protein JRG95_05610 [Deltaproteobacteria bacterium]|nr:hypothetical protein [Deltaproteobacteria bacterium]